MYYFLFSGYGGGGGGAPYGGGGGYGGGGYGGGGGGYGGGGGGGYGDSYSGGGGGSNLGQSLNNIDFAKAELIPVEFNFYIEHPDVTKKSDQEAEAWRASKQIIVQGADVPKPVMTFEEASMPEYVLSEVLKQGFDKPTPIQSQGWPMALKGRNMVGISATGSGKTLAFLLPGMIHINAQVSKNSAIVSARRYCAWIPCFYVLSRLDTASLVLYCFVQRLFLFLHTHAHAHNNTVKDVKQEQNKRGMHVKSAIGLFSKQRA
jgi:hypothetical protein